MREINTVRPICKNCSGQVVRIGSKVRENLDYDAENDVLYVNFHDPPLTAHDSRRVGRFILRYRFGEFIGMTIVDASSLLDDAQSSA